jgi:glycosyltransferase involved in cell wall biosynthesis
MKVAIVTDTAEGCPGIDRYARELIAQLIKSELIEELVLAHSKNWTQRARPLLQNEQRTKVRELLLPLPNTPFRKEVRQTFIAPFMLDKERVDIVHDLHHFAPFLLSSGDYRKVATVHDLTPFITRGLHPLLRRASFFIRYRYVLPLILRRADVIIAISGNTKKDLVRYLGIAPNKIRVVYHGISEDYYPIEDAEKLNKVRHRYGLSFPFVLGQATSAPVDNIGILIEAFRLLRTEMSYDDPALRVTKLVFFGHYNPEAVSVVKKMGFENEVIFLGYIPEPDLHLLYNAAELFVYPSLYDGFGFPPLEAMACGTPTMVSSTASLPEVVGNASLTFNPRDPAGIAQEIHNVLTNEDLKRNLIAKGLERAKKFKWENTARETLQVYQDLLELKAKHQNKTAR